MFSYETTSNDTDYSIQSAADPISQQLDQTVVATAFHPSRVTKRSSSSVYRQDAKHRFVLCAQQLPGSRELIQQRVFLRVGQFAQIPRCGFEHPRNNIAVFKCRVIGASPADAVSKRVMHSCITAPRYDWPKTDFPFRQTAVHHSPVTPGGSSCVTKFRPLLTSSGETA